MYRFLLTLTASAAVLTAALLMPNAAAAIPLGERADIATPYKHIDDSNECQFRGEYGQEREGLRERLRERLERLRHERAERRARADRERAERRERLERERRERRERLEQQRRERRERFERERHERR